MILQLWIEQLRKQGHKVTAARRRLLEHLVGREAPFTAEELHGELAMSGVGRATVFRTLKLLQDEGILVRVHLEHGCQHYQAAPGIPGAAHHHDRIVCRECGDIALLDECPMRSDVSEIAGRSGFRLQGHHLDLYGICRSCEGKDASSDD